MRHKKIGKHFNRTPEHKRSMMYNMSKSLIKHESIITTLQKAKEVRRYIEPIITLSKEYTLANKRKIAKNIKEKDLLFKLFNNLGVRYQKRNGGYTRIYKYKYRKGDAAKMAVIELVDKNLNEKKN